MVQWSEEDLMQEVTSMASLLEKRGRTTNLATSLADQFCKKLEGATMSATALLALTEHVTKSALPEACKDQILAYLDDIAMGEAPQSAMTLSLSPQTCNSLHNYLTASEWKTLETSGLWAGVHVLIKRLRLIGVKSLKESLKKRAVGILVLMELQRNPGQMPLYKEIYDLGKHFAQAFASSEVQPPAGVKTLLAYPNKPSLVGTALMGNAYQANDPPVEKDLPDLAYLVLNHIPTSNTSKLLLDEATKHVARPARSKRNPPGGSEVQDLALALAAPLKEALQDALGKNSAESSAQQQEAIQGLQPRASLSARQRSNVLALPYSSRCLGFVLGMVLLLLSFLCVS